jgi:hypothetical protein
VVGLFVVAGRDLSRERNHFRLRYLWPAWPEQIAQPLYQDVQAWSWCARGSNSCACINRTQTVDTWLPPYLKCPDDVGMIIADRPSGEEPAPVKIGRSTTSIMRSQQAGHP